jgi:hypothetical protein
VDVLAGPGFGRGSKTRHMLYLCRRARAASLVDRSRNPTLWAARQPVPRA